MIDSELSLYKYSRFIISFESKAHILNMSSRKQIWGQHGIVVFSGTLCKSRMIILSLQYHVLKLVLLRLQEAIDKADGERK
jgi:hypothetical protein